MAKEPETGHGGGVEPRPGEPSRVSRVGAVTPLWWAGLGILTMSSLFALLSWDYSSPWRPVVDLFIVSFFFFSVIVEVRGRSRHGR